jgi:hypothetical protein
MFQMRANPIRRVGASWTQVGHCATSAATPADNATIVRSRCNITRPPLGTQNGTLRLNESPLVQGLFNSFELLTVEEGDRNDGTPIFQTGHRVYHPGVG